jgi:hypothetical protein
MIVGDGVVGALGVPLPLLSELSSIEHFRSIEERAFDGNANMLTNK